MSIKKLEACKSPLVYVTILNYVPFGYCLSYIFKVFTTFCNLILHLTMNLRLPLSRMGNRTSIEVQTAAYKKHVSQQWCWFYVSDDYEYSCADFGLYRTTVGNDTGNDMLENITTYEEQERLAKEAAEKESIESSKAAEEASIAKEQQEIKAAHKETSKRKVSVAVIVIIVVIIIGAAAFGYVRLQQSRRKHSRRRR